MTNRLDNLQIVLDRTDWHALRAQRSAARGAKIALEGIAGSTEIGKLLDELVTWLETIEDAAKMDGYQIKEPTQ